MKIAIEMIKELAKEFNSSPTHPHFTPYGVEILKSFLETEKMLKQSKDKLKADLKVAEVKQVKAYVARDKAVTK